MSYKYSAIFQKILGCSDEFNSSDRFKLAVHLRQKNSRIFKLELILTLNPQHAPSLVQDHQGLRSLVEKIFSGEVHDIEKDLGDVSKDIPESRRVLVIYFFPLIEVVS